SDVFEQLERFEGAEADGLDARALRYAELDPIGTRSVARVRDQLVRALRARPTPSRSLDDDEESLSLALLAAYPDRVARRRAPRSDDLFFAEGGSAKLDPGSV